MFLSTKKNNSTVMMINGNQHLAPMSGRQQGVVGTVTNWRKPPSLLKRIVATGFQLIIVMQKPRLVWV